MEFSWKYLAPIANSIESLQARFAGAGLDTEDVVRLLDCGLELSDVLDYVDALASRRIH